MCSLDASQQPASTERVQLPAGQEHALCNLQRCFWLPAACSLSCCPLPTPHTCSHFLRYILHDWSDAAARQILGSIRASIPPGAEATTLLLIQDAVLPDTQPGALYAALDLQASWGLLSGG